MQYHNPKELCAACRGINIEDLASENSYLHSPNFSALAKSATSTTKSCPLCIRFYLAYAPFAANLSAENDTPLVIWSRDFLRLYTYFGPRENAQAELTSSAEPRRSFKLCLPFGMIAHSITGCGIREANEK